jgi:pilus assembly protein CpaE
MDAWIISDNDERTSCIRQSLKRLDIDCPDSRVLAVDSVRQSAAMSSAESTLVFFVVERKDDDHLDVLHHLQSKSKAHLVLISSGFDHASVLKAIRAGAKDVLNGDADLHEEIVGFVSRMATASIQQLEKGRLLSIVPCYAPSDSSILAVNMAAVIAKHMGACCLLDFQLRGGDLALLLKIRPRHTLYDLINQRQNVDGSMFQQALTRHDSGIRLLAGPELFADLHHIEPHVCQDILAAAQSSHPFVIVNSEDIQHTEQILALASSDIVVLTMRMDLVSLHRAQRHIDFLKRNRVSPEHLHIVAMGTGRSGDLPVASVKKVLRVPTIHCIPDDAEAITVSINVGNPLVLEAPKSKASQAINDLVLCLAGWKQTGHAAEKRGRIASAKAAALVAINAISFCK